MNDHLQADLPIDDSTEVQPKYSTFDDNDHYDKQDKLGTIPATSKMKLHVRAKCPPPPNSGTTMLDPRVQKLVEYRERKNAMSRERAKNHREKIAAITTRSLENMTEHDANVFASHAAFRKRKNTRSRERSLEKKHEKERIMTKPIANRTPLERKFLKNAIAANRQKIEGDRRRRKKYKIEKCNNSSFTWNPQSPSLQIPGSWSTTGNKAIATIWPPHQEAYYGMLGIENQTSLMNKFNSNGAGMNTGVIMNAAAAAGVIPLSCYQHLTTSRMLQQVSGGERGLPGNTTTCSAQEVTNPHCPISNIPCPGGLLQNHSHHRYFTEYQHEFSVGCTVGGAADMSPSQISYESLQGIASLHGQPHCHTSCFPSTGDGSDDHHMHHQPLVHSGSTMTPCTFSPPRWPPAVVHHHFMNLIPPSPHLVLTDTTTVNDGMIYFPHHITVPIMQESQEECHIEQQQFPCIDSFGAAGTELQQDLLLTCNPLTTSGTTTTTAQQDIISPFVLMSDVHASMLNAPLEERNDPDELEPLIHSFIANDDEDDATVETIEW